MMVVRQAVHNKSSDRSQRLDHTEELIDADDKQSVQSL